MKEELVKTRKISKTKASKRRARNKRRKKEKQLRKQQEQQQQELQDDEEEPTPTTSTAATTTKTAPQIDQTHQQHSARKKPSSASAINAANAMWQRTYENSLRWICNQQMEFLRQRVDHLQQENDYLKAQLYNRDNVDSADEYITSPSGSEDYDDYECDDEPPEIDEGYLKFMEITLRHREELRKSRELEASRKRQEDINET